MDSKKTLLSWLLALAFLAAAGATRFARLGWSMKGDEPSSFEEVRSLLEKPFFSSHLTTYDIAPRAQPLAYLLHAATFRLFGRDEAGCRTGAALAGTLAVALAVLLSCRLHGPITAVVLGCLLVLWPWHLFHSQNARMYSYAFLFGSAAMLTGAVAWRRDSAAWAAAAGVASGAAMSCHNVAILIPVAFAVHAVLERIITGRPIPRRAVIGYVATAVPLVAGGGLLAWLARHNWAGQQQWGARRPGPTLKALALNLTWGVTLLSAAGWLWSWRRGSSTDRMWAATAAVLVLAACFAPYLTAFRHDYVFPASLAFFLLAARVLATAFSHLRRRSLILAAGLVVTFLLLGLPSLVSYYQDGDRADFRTAANFIKERRRDGDLIAGNGAKTLRYYLGGPIIDLPRLSSSRRARCMAVLEKLSAGGKRTWIVAKHTRSGSLYKVPKLDRWLWRHTVRMLRVRKQRFDYHDNIVDVYLFDPHAAPGDSAR